MPTHKLCGKVRGYSYGAVAGFAHRPSTVTANENYVDGVSITYGSSPAHHLWTYAAGLEEGTYHPENCPCNTQSGKAPPSLVGNDYYCESGSPNHPTSGPFTWFTGDPLWDGAGCGGQVLVAIVMGCPGLKRAYQFLPLPLLVCVSVVILVVMKILVFNVLSSTSNKSVSKFMFVTVL